jgi:hypothetical protein
MTEEASSASIRSSQGSHRRTPKNVSMPWTFRAHQPSTLDARLQQPTLTAMQPQQQLSQIEKSVTHLLVATKQLLGSLHAPTGTRTRMP